MVKDDTVTYRTRSGMKLTLRTRTSDRNVFNDLWLDRVYDFDMDAWAGFTTIIDIGAHIGMFTMLGALRSPDARIIALEPEASNVTILRRNVDQNSLQARVTVLAMGIAPAIGTMPLYVSRTRGEQNSSFHHVKDGAIMEMPVTTLEHVLASQHIQECDLLKINCEGGEYEMLYRLPSDLFPRIKRMVINYHLFSPNPTHHPQALSTFLESQGYDIERRPHEMLMVRRRDAL